VRSGPFSDLIGVPATIVALVVFLLPVAVFVVGIAVGPVVPAVIVATIVAAIVWGGAIYLARRAVGGRVDISDIAPPSAATPRRVLVVGNEGL
jgi:hypothetical protein